jgi:hypothetical protein
MSSIYELSLTIVIPKKIIPYQIKTNINYNRNMKSKTTAKQHWEIKLQIANKYYKTNTQIATKLSYKMKSKTTTKQH